jgi:hypothetical protein
MVRARNDWKWSGRRWTLAVAAAVAAIAAAVDVSGSPFRAPVAVAQTTWFETARASFDGVADGQGDGKTFPATLGSINVSTASGKALHDIATAAGISKEQLLLSDNGSLATTTFGYSIIATQAAAGGAYASFVAEPRADGGNYSFELTDGEGNVDDENVDCCCPGSVGDGGVVEMFAIHSDEGIVSVNGRVLGTSFKKGARYRFEAILHDETGDHGDWYELWVTNLTTGTTEYVNDVLAGGYRPVKSLALKKLAGKQGDVAIDDIVILAPVK